jgi:NADH:ubiquinone oxidoreductase subunit 4 (subunit M)
LLLNEKLSELPVSRYELKYPKNKKTHKLCGSVFGSLFLLLAILTMYSLMGTTDLDALYKSNFTNQIQMYLFIGIFIAFAVKTPTIFLNN